MSLPQRVRIADQLIRRRVWDDVDRAPVRRLVELARDEALRNRPAASAGARRISMSLIAAEDFVFCGAGLVPMIAAAFGLKGAQRARASDGASVGAGQELADLEGNAIETRLAAGVLAEFFGRLGGIATRARSYADALGNGRTRLLDSGAATPGWHELEKFALGCGGAWDGGATRRIRIEATAGGIDGVGAAVRRARESAPDAPVEVVLNDPAHVSTGVESSPDILRLEGFSIPAIRRATASARGRVFVEAHGGITLRNLSRHAGLGLDFVSIDGLVREARFASIECREGDGRTR